MPHEYEHFRRIELKELCNIWLCPNDTCPFWVILFYLIECLFCFWQIIARVYQILSMPYLEEPLVIFLFEQILKRRQTINSLFIAQVRASLKWKSMIVSMGHNQQILVLYRSSLIL